MNESSSSRLTNEKRYLIGFNYISFGYIRMRTYHIDSKSPAILLTCRAKNNGVHTRARCLYIQVDRYQSKKMISFRVAVAFSPLVLLILVRFAWLHRTNCDVEITNNNLLPLYEIITVFYHDMNPK